MKKTQESNDKMEEQLAELNSRQDAGSQDSEKNLCNGSEEGMLIKLSMPK